MTYWPLTTANRLLSWHPLAVAFLVSGLAHAVLMLAPTYQNTGAAGVKLHLEHNDDQASTWLQVSFSEPGDALEVTESIIGDELAGGIIKGASESVIHEQPGGAGNTPASTSQDAGGEPAPPVAEGGSYYFKASELDRKPFPLANVIMPEPKNPVSIAVALVRIRINVTGTVDSVLIADSQGDPEFAEQVIAKFMATRFRPGYIRDYPVRSELLIEATQRPLVTTGMQHPLH